MRQNPMQHLIGVHRASRLALAVLLALTLVLASPAPIWAHPLGNFSVNRYSRLELAAGRVQVYYVVDMAEIPAFQERARIDADHDGSISPTERAQYLDSQVAALQSNLRLLADGVPIKLEPHSRHMEFLPGQGGLDTLRLSLRFVAMLPPLPTPLKVEYTDDNYAGRLGWQEIVVRATPDVALLESTVPTQDVSQELRNYPQDLLQSPLAVRSAHFRLAPQAVSEQSDIVAADAAAAIRSRSRAPDRFAELIAIPDLSHGAFWLALLAAFVWGAAHALTPGHGKTVVAAYLVGSRGTLRHAIILGLTATATHTAGVFILGLLTLFASHFILPERLYPWLEVISGLLVVTIGVSLFRRRLRHLVRSHHDDPARAHDHLHDHSHDHGHDHDHDHQNYGHVPAGADGTPITWRSLLALGVSGGLLPCPSALVVMLGAIALQRVAFGLLLITIFSFGLASVLTGIGVLFVHAGRLIGHVPLQGRLVRALPVVSALFVTVVGLGITLQGLIQTGPVW